MGSAFEAFRRLGPAAFVLEAILAAIVVDALLLAFIMVRRSYRKRYFAKRDARVFEFRQKWDALISGEIPYESWRKKPFDRRIVETIALDALDRKSTRLNSSHVAISYAVFCLKKKNMRDVGQDHAGEQNPGQHPGH